MIDLGRIWAPSGKDAATGVVPQFFHRRIDNTANLAALTLTLPFTFIGSDEVAIVSFIGLQTQASGGLTVDFVFSRITDASAVANFGQLEDAQPGVNQFYSRIVDPQLLFFNDEQLLLTAIYSAAGANNALSISAAGYVMPRGNWQRR